MPRPHAQPIDDLGCFLQICEHLETCYSLREVAATMGMAAQSANDVVVRLEHHYNCVLIERTTSTKRARLTEYGQKLFAELRRCLNRRYLSGTTLRVKLSHSLMQNRMILSVLNKFGEELKSQPDGTELELSGGVDLDDDQELENILTGQLDILLCWAIPQRTAKWGRMKTIDPQLFGPECPLVLISHSKSIIGDCLMGYEPSTATPWEPFNGTIAFEEIVKNRCALLDPDSQPMDEELLRSGIYLRNSNRVSASSFQSVVELVRARIADVGILPLMGAELDPLRLADEVYYQALPTRHNNVATAIRMAAVSKLSSHDSEVGTQSDEVRRRPRHLGELKSTIIGSLRHALNHSLLADTCSAFLYPLTDNPFFYRKLKYGYYLFRPDEKRRPGDQFGVTTWHRETFTAIEMKKSKVGLVLTSPKPLIRNDRGQVYEVEEARLMDGAFSIVAREEAGTSDGEASAFISVFTVRVELGRGEKRSGELDPPAIVAGVWFGGGGRKSSVAAWATVYSSIPLTDDLLNVISRTVSGIYSFSSSMHSTTDSGISKSIPEESDDTSR